jgi:lariat debranching enzyme
MASGPRPAMSPSVRVAVEGCGHGELDQIYDGLRALQARMPDSRPVDLLICCGDFQSVRNEEDLECMACPQKYRSMQSFYKYYTGERVAPVLTLFVGGNHEATNHLQELRYGGWVAPNIYYLGSSGVVRFRGLRIGGVSGIYKSYNYREGYYERAPYSEDWLKSAFHVREFDHFMLRQVSRRAGGRADGQASRRAGS